jgi:segregation and condensation protein A
MGRIHERLVQHRRVTFSELFGIGMHKSAMIGVFLAVLELVRYHNVTTEQPEMHGEIWILPGEEFAEQLNIGEVDNYERKPVSEEMPVQGR